MHPVLVKDAVLSAGHSRQSTDRAIWWTRPCLMNSTDAGCSVLLVSMSCGTISGGWTLIKVSHQYPSTILRALYGHCIPITPMFHIPFLLLSLFILYFAGHVMAPALAHAFCNHMGFPDFQEVLAYKGTTRLTLAGCFVAGLLLWMYLLYPLTNPYLYGNNVYRLL